MFSEERAVIKGNDKKIVDPKKKDLNFDSLEDKINEKMGKMTLDKKPMKYSAEQGTSPALEKKASLKKEKSSTHSLNINMGKKSKEVGRSNSMEKVPDAVGHGLYEAAAVMCNIVDISQDSTMKGAKQAPSERKMVRQRTQTELDKKASVSSLSGPFSAMKESAQQKKKKSIDNENDNDAV